MRRRPVRPLLRAAVMGAVALLGACLMIGGPFDWSTQPLSERALIDALPRGKDMPGYHARRAGADLSLSPSQEHLCGPVSTALITRHHKPAGMTQVMLTPLGQEKQQHHIESYSYTEDDAERIMGRIRAAVPTCAHYNSFYADLYSRHGLRPAKSPYQVGDEMVTYRMLEPPPGDVALAGSQIPMEPGPLQEPGRTITFVRTGGVITQYKDPVPKAVAEELHRRFRRAAAWTTSPTASADDRHGSHDPGSKRPGRPQA
ncbi:hypothetical protein [Streptomyces sp. NPDC057939]|uniref:hypothetical protein n=1 Tax=Streptomyces sp. NPDC057939 TaxID=3346284 RepID=UPI0036E22E6C